MALPAFANRGRNPYNALLYSALRARGVKVEEFDDHDRRTAADIVHVHWPESHLNHARWVRAAPRSIRRLRTLKAARRRGARLVWTVHNIASHERRHPRTERLFWRQFVPLVDGWTTMSPDAAAVAVERFPRLASRPTRVIPHGHYRGVYPDQVTRADARARLGVPADAAVAAFVGRIKSYKGVPELIRAFGDLARDDARLVVAGRVETAALSSELRAASRDDDRVLLRESAVPDHELQLVLRAADLVVAPFESVLNSGSVLLALSFDRPVLAPAVGSLPALREAVGPHWLDLYSGHLDSKTLGLALARPRPPGEPDLSAFEWGPIAEATEHLYRRVVDHPNASRR